MELLSESYASVRIDVRRREILKDGSDSIGNRVRAKIVKNKVAPPFKEVEFDIMYNEGISKVGDVLDLAINFGIVERSGSWFTYGDERVQRRDALKKLLQENEGLFQRLYYEVRKQLGLIPSDTSAEEIAEEIEA